MLIRSAFAFSIVFIGLLSFSCPSHAGSRWTFTLLSWEARDIAGGPDSHISQSTGFLVDNSGGKISICTGKLRWARGNATDYVIEAYCQSYPMTSAIALGPNVETYAAANQIVRNSTFENEPSFWQLDSSTGAIQFCARDRKGTKVVCAKPQ